MGSSDHRRVPRQGNTHIRNSKVVVVHNHQTTTTTKPNKTKQNISNKTKNGLVQVGKENLSTLEKVESFAKQTLNDRGLSQKGWTMSFGKSKTEFGVCNFTTKTIIISEPLVNVNSDEEIQDTILHEVAHALVGFSAGHGPKWKAMAEKIGARPEREGPSDITKDVVSKWLGTCPNCAKIFGRHRLTKSAREAACPVCCKQFNDSKFSHEYQLVWVET